MTIARKIHINGIVQGVGFRPFVYSSAKRFNLTGWVRNSSAGVDILVNGEPDSIGAFLDHLKIQAPPLSQIDEFDVKEIPADGFKDFTILSSQATAGEFIPVSVDTSLCDECLAELRDPSNRRYRYPFINCTNCGPRFTIIKDIPYDRPLTTMADFQMCENCQTEYKDPGDRRFHAQPIACPQCGPAIWFESADYASQPLEGETALQAARDFIRSGKILSVKGLGGFHLACDATNARVVERLRSRKKRSDKPFALMARDVDSALKYCYISESEKRLLESKAKPIVILKRREDGSLPESVAPHVKTLGIMLPYTPLHYLLLEEAEDFPEILVMTSGNFSEEPIVYSNTEARDVLQTIADGFLLHDRAIETRLDDSVVCDVRDETYFLRRSRGYTPAPMRFSQEFSHILATGAEQKNTFCLTRDHYAFVSHHIGDLENLETLKSFEEGIPHYERLFKIKPQAIACDLHPDYLSTRYATQRACEENLRLIPVQHHHAHLASVLAENHRESDQPVIGVILDGTGFGGDGAIWGGEILFGGYAQFERKFHLSSMPLPGGDAAIRHPNRIAAAYLWKSGIEWAGDIPAIASLQDEELAILQTQLEKRINTPNTSSMGRLFDAIAGLIGLRAETNYQAQAAIELENAIEGTETEAYSFDLEGQTINFSSLLRDVINDLRAGTPSGAIAARFHNAIRQMILRVTEIVSRETGCQTVALSGGVWQNQYLIHHTIADLEKNGFQALSHRHLPANDGGIALGQALIANSILKG